MKAPRAALALAASLVALAACGGAKSTTTSTGGHPTGTGGATGSSSSGAGGVGGAAPKCGTDGWLTYGHDARRTSASDGCVNGPLDTSWRYAPAPPAGKTSKDV